MARAHGASEPFVQHHVCDFRVAHSITPSRAFQQIWGVRHGFSATGHDDVHVAHVQGFDGMGNGLEAGAADAVDRFRRNLDREPCFDRRLTGDIHSSARLKNATENHVADFGRRYLGARDCFADRHRAEIHSGEVFQLAAERSNRRSAGADDDGFHKKVSGLS